MHDPEHSPLGKAAAWPEARDPRLLYPIPRARGRGPLGLVTPLPFVGCDLWNAYELSWLDPHGKPQVALAELCFDSSSPNIVESKSLKLYLGSYAQTCLADSEALAALLADDLGAASGAPVAVRLVPPAGFAAQRLEEPEGQLIDDLPLAIGQYGPPDAGLLHCIDGAGEVEETLLSHLLKSNCPVTGQPDWASLQIRYRGPAVDHGALLRYIVSFRQHSGFHEQCVERIFVDILQRCQPRELDVYARYTRRGGIDINPWRSTSRHEPPANPRGARQ
ncbi:MAG TPA: NADPH-dependent 7-cyano-7-deazaguanine reductase QueF [Rhodanobacteraceae bacterium]|nr:NADPH-dependent 7-cyano-7-deazaguanine reductase QueF [Rhodanobacteraceae bacterium]